MNIIFTSESMGRAESSTRKILDRYASRIGNNCWGGTFSQEGLETVRALLRRASSRQMSVACHRFNSFHQRTVMWIVGNKKKYNTDGECATNYTKKDISMTDDSSLSFNVRVILRVASLAGLLHDIGKSIKAFQMTLRMNDGDQETLGYQLIRHEALSVMMLKFLLEFSKKDDCWLDNLSTSILDGSFHTKICDSLSYYKTKVEAQSFGCEKVPGFGIKSESTDLFKSLVFLIVSHHRLTSGSTSKEENNVSADFENHWAESLFVSNKKFALKAFEVVPDGLPWQDASWVRRITEDINALKELLSEQSFSPDLLDHARLLGRPVMLLADHLASSMKKPAKHDLASQVNFAFANTVKDEKTKRVTLGQTLSQHSLMVSRYTYRALKELTNLRNLLPSIEKSNLPDSFRKSADEKFKWQDEAVSCIKSKNLGDSYFFGIFMADTGSGKTIASIKAATALSGNLRIALTSPMRMLTLQTGDSLRDSIGFAKDDMAVVIGDPLVEMLHNFNKLQNEKLKEVNIDSLLEISNENDDDEIAVAGGYLDSDLSEKIRTLACFQKESVKKMIVTPVLSATLDTVMKMADARRGSHLAHQFRIASSDFVIDEPDMFSPEDLAAISRTVEAMGFWGCRVFISTATPSPQLIEGLFLAWHAGVKLRQSLEKTEKTVNVGWISNRVNCEIHKVDSQNKVMEYHKSYCKKLNESKIKSKREIVGYIDSPSLEKIEETIKKIGVGVAVLHEANKVEVPDSGRSFSVGCIQVVNVKTCQALSDKLSLLKIDGISIKVTCHHARMPLVLRNIIDSRLNIMLNRHGQKGSLAPMLDSKFKEFFQSSEGDVIEIIVSTMETTGRDHDYDWGIIESKSYRDIVQFAGRIHRHRDGLSVKNLILFNQPFSGKYERFGVCDKVMGEEIKLSATYRSNEVITYQQMIKSIYDGEYPEIDNSKVILADTEIVDMFNDETCGKFWVSDVLKAERLRMHIALLDTQKRAVKNSFDWLTSPSVNRMLSNVPMKNRFRSGHPGWTYWRINGEWVFSKESNNVSEKLKEGRYQSEKDHCYVIKNTPSNQDLSHMMLNDVCLDDEIKKMSEVLNISKYLGNLLLGGINERFSPNEYKGTYDDLLGFY